MPSIDLSPDLFWICVEKCHQHITKLIKAVSAFKYLTSVKSSIVHRRNTGPTLFQPLSGFPIVSLLSHSSTLIWRDCASYKTIDMKANAREQSDLALATRHLSSFTPTWLWLFRNRKGVLPWKTGANESNAGRELFGSAFLPPRLGFLFAKPTNSVRTLLCNHEQRLGVPASLSDVINGARPPARLALPALQIFPWYLMNSDKLLFSHCVPPSLSLSLPLFFSLSCFV